MAASIYPFMTFWRKRVQEWYPDLYRRAYFLPPVFFNRTHYHQVQIAGQTIHVTQPPVSDLPCGAAPALQQSHVRDDVTQVKVLRCLHALSEVHPEVMFVISQLDFGDYLNKPVYAAAASMLPRPIQLRSQHKHRGDFDILIIHRQYGILVCEIKAIGDETSVLTQQELELKIASKVRQAVRQLQKADTVLSHVVSDQPTAPRIQTTLMLPNVTTAQLQSVLAADPQLSTDLCQCLSVASNADPSVLCLTSDDLIGPDQWWQLLMARTGPDPAMTDAVYLDLISRFSGPATTVTVACTSVPRLHMDMRTEGEGTAETGWQFTQLVLHPSQLSVLNTSEKLVFLTGPPGCGKTVVLVLKGLCWLDRGKPVQVVSTWNRSLAASHMIFKQLQQTAGLAASGRVHLHTFDLWAQNGVRTAVTTLMASVSNGELFILCDEIEHSLNDLVTELHRQCPGVHLWTAAMHHRYKPSLMTEFVLTEPLRTPPAVTREVQCSGLLGQGCIIYDYTTVPSPLPCDGPAPRVVLHQGQEHGADRILDCQQCGRDVARILQELFVGSSASSSQPPLSYKDVFLLADLSEFTSEGKQPLGGLVQGLQQAGVPVTVVQGGDAGAVADMATMSGPDHVIVTDTKTVQGLERKVVVWVPLVVSDNVLSRLHAMSRCTAQLVVIKR